MGQEATLRCKPISGHSGVYWYRQTTVLVLEFLISFFNQAPIDDTGMPKERFSAQMPDAKLSTLKIQTTQSQDSAVYLCASSLDTELQNHIRLGQKPCFPFPVCLPETVFNSDPGVFSEQEGFCVDTMFMQNPRYKVAMIGKPVNLSCSQSLNHDAMYWYQQKPNQAPKLLLYYYDTTLNREADTSENFQSNRPNTSFCSLGIRSAGLGDSSMYLCASSRDTGLQHHQPSVHKPFSFPDPGLSFRTTPPFLQQ
ncbi:T-cell receptor beta chain V region CTL-F3 [Microtus ochrogaster]|nr:T-cell receptor beta chain V region CTL-F3 [Microtus ochrogaster]